MNYVRIPSPPPEPEPIDAQWAALIPDVVARVKDPNPPPVVESRPGSTMGAIRAAIANGERDVNRIMDLTGGDKSRIYAELLAHRRRTGEAKPPRTMTDKIREALEQGLMTREEIMKYTGTPSRNLVNKVKTAWLNEREQERWLREVMGE